jgi:hypothetical protein
MRVLPDPQAGRGSLAVRALYRSLAARYLWRCEPAAGLPFNALDVSEMSLFARAFR